jgi:hypothetical protein
LQCKYVQRPSRSPWQPLDREERHERHPSRYQQLPEMGSSPLIGLTGSAEECNAPDTDTTSESRRDGVNVEPGRQSWVHIGPKSKQSRRDG